MTPTLLAHGVGTRADLPIPTWLALYGSGTVVLLSFVFLLFLWRRPKLTGGHTGRPLPSGLQHVLSSTLTRTLTQVVTLALSVFVLAVALAGPGDPANNISPWALYVTFWVGLVPASLLLGPVWRYANPLRLLHRLLAPLAGAAPAADRLERLGLWPAAAALSVFVWLELVFPDRSLPGTVGVFLVIYALLQLAASLWYGEEWFAHADGFEVYSTLIARLSPWGIREDGRWVARNPLRNATGLPYQPGLPAVLMVLLGSTAFDGLSRTEYWTTGPGKANDTLSGTIGLAVMIAIVSVLYVVGSRLSGRAGTGPADYAHTVLPIALGYAVAHYFSLLLLDGQTTYILASNPFAQDGVDLFGTYGNVVNYLLVSTATIAYVQVGAIVVGHVLGVLLAHERALVEGPERARTAQLPLVVVMIAFTVGGIGLLFGA